MNKKGQSLIEILVAVSVGTILILGVLAVISPALKSNKDVEYVQIGTGIARELLDDVKVFSESDWHNITNLSVGSNNKYFFNKGSSTLVVATGTEGVVATGVVNGLVGYWKFDEASGGTVFDFSSGGRHATTYNDVTRGEGMAAAGGSFGGTTGHIIPANSGSLKYQGAGMAISLWMKHDGTDDGGFLISKPWNGSGQYNFYISTPTGANPIATFALSGATSYTLNSGIAITPNTWHHLAVTVDSSSTVKFYVDGKLTKSGTHSISNWSPSSGDGNVNLSMGCVYPYGSNSCAGSTGYAFKGLLDEIRIYNRTLSDSEISALHGSKVFDRSFYVENVNRDGSGSIVSSGGNNDPSTKKVIINYHWFGSSTSTLTKYITRSKNRAYIQTDWSGGSGQTESTTTINSKFSSSTNINYSSSTGSIKINL